MNKLIFLLLFIPAIANAETKVTGNEISGMWATTKSVALSATSTTTITGLQAGKHYKLFFALTQNTSAGDLRLLINSKSGSGYSSASFGHNSGGATGANYDSSICILQYTNESTAAGYDQMGEYSFYVNSTSRNFTLHGRFQRTVGTGDVDGIVSCRYQDIGSTTFPISIYTTGGTVSGTIYIQEYIP